MLKLSSNVNECKPLVGGRARPQEQRRLARRGHLLLRSRAQVHARGGAAHHFPWQLDRSCCFPQVVASLVLLLSLVGDVTTTNALAIPIMYAALMYQHIDTWNHLLRSTLTGRQPARASRCYFRIPCQYPN